MCGDGIEPPGQLGIICDPAPINVSLLGLDLIRLDWLIRPTIE